MADIYDQHKAAFANVSAYVVLDKKGARVATVAFKHGASVKAYVHWIGLAMVRGNANGGGYDRATAACAHAAEKLPLGLDAATGTRVDPSHAYNDFKRALAKDGGNHWNRELENAGFTVLQAV